MPSVSVLRLGDRHPSVAPLRARLAASGDIDPNAVGNDIYDSYVEAGVRRFQARHGLTVDGVIRAETLAALNVPAPVRLAQLKVNVTRLRALSGAFELCRDLLVGTRGRLGAVPGAAVRIDLWVGGRRQRGVRGLALLNWRRPVGRSANQRMTKPDVRAELDQAGIARRRRGLKADRKAFRRSSSNLRQTTASRH